MRILREDMTIRSGLEEIKDEIFNIFYIMELHLQQLLQFFNKKKSDPVYLEE